MKIDLDRQLDELRPKLHRYCARMTGSAIDGEDVVQDTLAKAIVALSGENEIDNLEKWLFRIAHNVSIDFLRRRARFETIRSDADPDLLADREAPIDDPEVVSASLRTFMRLHPAQRGAVILMDVLGYRLQEICEIMGLSLPAVKSSLHRGRMRLRELAREPEDFALPEIPQIQHALLSRYIERFNARDFDTIRDMLATEVKLELVSRERRDGKRLVSGYIDNYSRNDDWDFKFGLVDSRPAIIVGNPVSPSSVEYFILLKWDGDHVRDIRDFRYARYVMSSADVICLTDR